MGRHADAVRHRGIAGWVIAVVAVVVVLAAAAVGYYFVVGRADPAGQATCQGSMTLPVAAGPGAAAAVTAAASAYNATKPVARSTCITAVVTAVADDAALSGLTSSWPAGLGQAPGLWVPSSLASLTALDAVRPDLAAGHATDPIAWSPVVLAVRQPDAAALASLAWRDLQVAVGPNGTTALPGGAHLLLALPPIEENRATSYVLQSALAGADRTTALTAGDVTSGAAALTAIGAGSAGAATRTADALAALAAGDGSVTAVPVVEADLAAYNAAATAGAQPLAAVHPAGPTVGDALIAAPITASWTDQTDAAAASSFQAFLSDPAGQQILADHGWRTASARPAQPIPGVDTTTAVTRLPAGGPAVDAALAAGLGQPVPPSPLPTVSSAASSGVATTGTSAPTSASGGSTTATGASTTPATPATSGTAGTAATGSGTVVTTTPTTTAASTSANPAASGPVVTLVVDVSSGMSATVGGKTLLAWLQQALPTATDGKITDRVGLWAFSDSGALPPDGYPQLVQTGPLGGTVGGGTRAAALTAAIAGLKAGGDRWAYGALIAALRKAPDAAVAGRANRVVLITSGVDETPATPRDMVVAAETALSGKVRVDVIGLGAAVPAQAYKAVATAGGGEYIPVPDPSKLGQVLADLLNPLL